MNEKTKECPLCYSLNVNKLIRFHEHVWYKCAGCKNGFKFPYVSELESYSEDSEVNQTYLNYKNKEELFENVARRKLEWIISASNKKVKIIEIGPGIGVLARLALSRNIDYIGVEPSKYFYNYLISNGIPCIGGGDVIVNVKEAIDSCKLDGLLPVIFLDNVLEHVPDPKSFITKIFHSLPQNGSILVEVPNEYGISFKAWFSNLIRGQVKPPTFPGHINLFTGQDRKSVV